MTKLLSQLVTDWGGFERLVAALHQTGTDGVEHNVVLTGNSGAPRQIDVVVRHREGLYEHLIIVECKFWKENVSRLHVDALATAVRDLGASRGVIFSASGFQEGAITTAKQERIDLFKVRDLTDKEWGLPGQIIQLYLQFFQGSFGNFQVDKALAVGQPNPALNVQLGEGSMQTATLTLKQDGTNGPTLETIIEKSASYSLRELTNKNFTFNGGTKCTVYAMGKINIQPKTPLILPRPGGILLIEKLSYDLGIKIDQDPFRVDRLENFQFALVVEDCVKSIVSTASKTHDENTVTLSRIEEATPTPGEEPLVNGSVLKIYLKGYFPFEDLLGKTSVDMDFGGGGSLQFSLSELI